MHFIFCAGTTVPLHVITWMPYIERFLTDTSDCSVRILNHRIVGYGTTKRVGNARARVMVRAVLIAVLLPIIELVLTCFGPFPVGVCILAPPFHCIWERGWFCASSEPLPCCAHAEEKRHAFRESSVFNPPPTLAIYTRCARFSDFSPS